MSAMRGLRLRPILFLLCIGSQCLTGPSWAFEDPTPAGVGATTLKGPSGPGSLKGLGAKGEVNAFTGQMSFSVPIDTPQGPGGIKPGLALSYDGGLGNGPFGLGWRMEMPHIQRSLRHGRPTYNDLVDVPDGDELELVMPSASGRLIKLTSGMWSGQYRVEGMGHQVRVDYNDGTDTWTIYPGDGSRLFFNHRIRDEALGTWAWYVTEMETVDRHPDTVTRWTYRESEANTGHALPQRIGWGPIEEGIERFGVEFTYVERQDALTDWRTGFERRLGERVEGIETRVGSVSRGRYTLAYDSELPLSRLSSYRVYGARGDSLSLPATWFAYGGGTINTTTERVEGLDGWAVGRRGVVPQDVDGDGLADLVRYELGNHQWKRNLGGHFGAARALTGGGLWDLSVLRFADLDGDQRLDLFYRVDESWRRYAIEPDEANAGEFVWRARGTVSGFDEALLPDGPRDLLLDVDGDGFVDVLSSSGDGLLFRTGSASGFGAAVQRPPIALGDRYLSIGDTALSFDDINGDGLPDAVWLGERWLKVYIGRGDGTFVELEQRFCYPWLWQGDDGPQFGTGATGACSQSGPPSFDPTQVRLTDIDRDGMVDLVYVSAGYVYWYRGYWFAGAGDLSLPFGPAIRIDRPIGARFDDVVTFADLDGDGTQDVLWSTDDGMWVLRVDGVATAGMLTSYGNALGFSVAVDYSTTAWAQLAAEEAGTPWATPYFGNMPFPSGVTVDVPGSPLMNESWIVKDAFWDASERRFGGYESATQIAWDTSEVGTLATETLFARGDGESRVLRGKPLAVTRTDGTGAMIDHAIHSLDARVIDEMPVDEPLLRVGVSTEVSVSTFEGTCSPRVARTEFRIDSLGRVDGTYNEGEVGVAGDESVSISLFFDVSDWDHEKWIVGGGCGSDIRSPGGPTTLWDGALLQSARSSNAAGAMTPSLGACVGGVVDGRTRQSWRYFIEESRWLTLQTVDYDALGNPIATTEKGVSRTLTYDLRGIHPIEEAVVGAPVPLVWAMAWDEVLGVPLSLEAPSGAVQTFSFDALARPTGITQQATFGGPQELAVSYAYVLDGSAPGPRTITTLHESHGLSDRTSVQVHDAAGAERYVAVASDGGWLISDYRDRDGRGRTKSLFLTYADSNLPDPRVVGGGPTATSLPRHGVLYDALDRPVQQTLPPVPGFPQGTTRAVTRAPWSETGSQEGLAPITTEVDGLGRVRRVFRDIDAGSTALVTPAQPTTQAQEQSVTWDDAGRIVEVVIGPPGGAGAAHTFVWDSLGRIMQSNDPDEGDRWMTWDDHDRVLSVENGEGDTSFWTWDSLGRLATRRGLTSGGMFDETWSFNFDLPDNWQGVIEDHRASWGQLTAIHGPDGDRAFTYDVLGRTVLDERRVVGVPGANTAEVKVSWSHTYSRGGQPLTTDLSSWEGAGGWVQRLGLARSWDDAGRLRRLSWRTDGTSPYSLLWEAAAFTPSGATTLELAGNGVLTSFDRDVLDQVHAMSVIDVGAGVTAGIETWDPTNHTALSGGLASLQSAFGGAIASDTRYEINVTRNAWGGVTAVADPGWDPVTSGRPTRAAAFTYDGAGRLTGAQVAGHLFRYGHDAFNNLIHRELLSAPGGSPMPNMLSGAHSHGIGGLGPRQLGQVVTAAGTHGFSWDSAGRLVTITPPTGPPGAGLASSSLVYDAFDRLRVATDDDGVGTEVTTHTYGSDGHRTATRWPDGSVELRPALDLAAYGDGTGPLTHLTWHVGLGGPRQVARLAAPLGVTSALPSAVPKVLYLHQGFGPGTTLATGLDGFTVEERFFEPYGASLLNSVDYALEPHGSNAKPVDPWREWSDHGARWHATSLGRWISSDPPLRSPDGLVIHGLNATAFGFVIGNPLRSWDPDGHQPAPFFTGIAFTEPDGMKQIADWIRERIRESETQQKLNFIYVACRAYPTGCPLDNAVLDQIEESNDRLMWDALLTPFGGAGGVARGGAKMLSAERVLFSGAGGAYKSFSIPTADQIIASASRPAKIGVMESRGWQALQKKLNNEAKATHYHNVVQSEESVRAIIQEVVNDPNRLVKPGVNRNKDAIIDIFSPASGRGVRIYQETLEFDTFINIK